MKDDPINLDGRRSAAGQRETQMRRRPVNSPSRMVASGQPPLDELEKQMLADPARTWPEVMTKWRFLLERYAETPEAADARIQKLIQRALADLERLRKREAGE
ncbi:hypothetical protein [Maliponia aquimaris]|uniref:Uncharacterized protein n=1 Tax=Maliponia aquimaris TaxID=1673631 RepID=A0A238KMC2_9RHOB|nr:hypothetical protein [Maliponia aquimaris]SMX43999.1 hypothetical protein MAA8898_02961 [Maliponia aquimaris]